MESSILNEQGTVQIKSNILWTMQFVRDISMDNEQYILRAFIQGIIGKIYG